MKNPTIRTVPFVTVFVVAAVLDYTPLLHAQTANWTGVAADGNWNNAANWDIGVPAEGTNAVLGVGIVANYDAPMVAGSFGGVAPGLSLTTAILNVNASGFVIGASGTGAATITGSGSRLNVNAGGVLSLTNGGLTLGNVAAAALAPGGS